MPITLEEAVEQAHEAKGEWLETMMNWAVKNYEYKVRKRLGKLAFLLDNETEVHEGGKIR